MKKIIEKFSNLDSRIKRTIIGAIIVVVILIILVLIIGTINNRKLSYEKLEDKISLAAENYYKNNSDKLPQTDGGEVELNVDTLIEKEYIKELSEYNDDKCEAKVYTTKNGEEFSYNTYLKCDNYTTGNLEQYIKKNQGTVTKNDGLYQYGEEFIFRGENVNNYIEFADQLWRILRINSDGTIRIIQDQASGGKPWDNRYNINTKRYNGINDFEKSRIKDYLNEQWDNMEFMPKEYRKWVVAKNVCVDKKDNIDFGKLYDLSCNAYSEEKYPFSLIQLEEYFIASIDNNCNSIENNSCTNYNYLDDYTGWTITPSALSNNKVYEIGVNYEPSDANLNYSVYIVTNLSKHIKYSEGKGTAENPYKIK